MNSKIKTKKRLVRRKRIRAKVFGTAERPRLSVFRSNRYVSAQLIDDKNGVTLISISSKGQKGKNSMERAILVGKILAENAKSKKVTKVVFDRGGYIYTGTVAALAQGAREGGLEF